MTSYPELLLVEDSDDDAFFFKRSLKQSRMGCRISHVTDGAAAIDYLRQTLACDSCPKVIFLDLKMPVLNGFEVLGWMQTQRFPAGLRVIILSGSGHDDDQRRARQMGATEFLVKPIRVSDLHRCLRTICPAQPNVGAPA